MAPGGGSIDALTHAGGIAFRSSPRGTEFLVVGARRDPHWVLPKGHLEPGEAPEETAARELREEAGVDAEVVAHVGDADFVAPRGAGRVRFYLMRHRGEVPAEEERRVAWLPYPEAFARLSFDDQRRLLARARELVDTMRE